MRKFSRSALFCILGAFLGAIIYNFWPDEKLPKGAKVDYLLVEKSENVMKAFSGKQLVKVYKVSIGRNAAGHKQYEGDKKTPEGIYTINERSSNSGYHKNLGVSYPNKKDRENAARLGKSAGGEIKIHGLPNGIFKLINKLHRPFGFTNGCIMVTNNEIDELYAAVIPNAKIEIRP